MCGIVGSVGLKNSKEYITKGLKMLDYRGYDSAGIAFFKTYKVSLMSSVKKVIA